MPEQISLLDAIREGGYEACLITSFNLHFPFYEEVVLRRLVGSGVTHNLLLADARMCLQAVLEDPPRHAGRYYSLLPMAMPYAFHPKMVLLVGERKGLLMVGSHNATLSGFAINREATNAFRYTTSSPPDAASPFLAALDAVRYWVAACRGSLPPHALQMLERVTEFAPWLADAPPVPDNAEARIIASGPGHEALYDQIRPLLPVNCKDIQAVGAFFDRKLKLLTEWQQDLRPKAITIAVQPETVEGISQPDASRPWRWVNAVSLAAEPDSSASKYLHAKLARFRDSDGAQTVISGSANPSAPAWLAAGDNGNAEMVVVYRGDRARQAAEDLGLAVLDQAEELSRSDWETIATPRPTSSPIVGDGVRLGVARIRGTTVYVPSALLAPTKATLLEAVLDERDTVYLGQLSPTDHEELSLEGVPGSIKNAILIRAYDSDGALRACLTLHHEHALDQRARTGIQRQISHALASLDTDLSELGVLYKCVEQIVFARDDDAKNRGPAMRQGSKFQRTARMQQAPGLSVDMEELEDRNTSASAGADSNLIFLIEAMYAGLGSVRETLPDTDAYGRTEEEKIGADDDTTPNAPPPSSQEPAAVARTIEQCQQRTERMAQRMAEHVRQYPQNDPAKEPDAIRILDRFRAVLVFFSHLNKIGPELYWKPEGEPIVTERALSVLANAAFHHLFEGKLGLLAMTVAGEDTSRARHALELAPLLLWLAYKCGLRLTVTPPFNEAPSDKIQRFERNAILLALAQLFRPEPAQILDTQNVFDESSPEVAGWLERLYSIASLDCEALTDRDIGDAAKAGDVGLVGKAGSRVLRIIRSIDDKYAWLVTLDAEGSTKGFLRSYVMALPASRVLPSLG